jgi:hypothetical protein
VSTLFRCLSVLSASSRHVRRQSYVPPRGVALKTLRLFAMLVLLFVSVTALWGGTVLIGNSHGNPWGMMPLSLLAHSPFHSWMIPGMILVIANGLLALWTLWLALRRRPRCGLWSALQGFVLIGWLIVECIFLRTVIWPHYFYGSLALFLILSGFALQSGSTGRARLPEELESGSKERES